jgi:hypothetical protein
MKSGIKLIFTIIVCSVFTIDQLQAQKTSLPNLLPGEWTMSGQSKPQINDTITLSRKLSNSIDHPRWIFDLPNKLQQHYIFKDSKNGKAIAEANYSFEWYYDISSNLLRIRDESSDQYFNIISDNNQILKLICVK